jgi:hypothetical protein
VRTIALIPCASKKKPYSTRAVDLYDSHLFRLCLQYARDIKPDAIFILSAKHGLLRLDQEIEPYNVTLKNMSAAEVQEWAGKVITQLTAQADLQRDHFVILAGDRYCRHLLPHLSSYELPVEGLPIGKQLQRLRSIHESRLP